MNGLEISEPGAALHEIAALPPQQPAKLTMLDAWADRVSESGEIMILAVGIVLVAIGASRWLGLSPRFATLAPGATIVNASPRSAELVGALGRADPPLYAAFFVLAAPN